MVCKYISNYQVFLGIGNTCTTKGIIFKGTDVNVGDNNMFSTRQYTMFVHHYFY